MSTRNPTHGQKVTTESNVPDSLEGAGSIASDSLAADSYRDGGDFSKNRNSEPQGVSGANSTFANENTSGARRLDPAIDAEARMAEEDWAEEKKLGAAATAYSGPEGGEEMGDDVGTAPSYVNSQFRDASGPKGKNLQEGGFESGDYKNASFNNEIGTRKDPGRLAEKKFQRDNADFGGEAGFPKQEGVMEDNTYDALKRDERA